MIFESECPDCHELNSIELSTWDDSLAHPSFCNLCSRFYWIRRTADISETIVISDEPPAKNDIPPYPVKSEVYVNNKEHEFFLERGIIVKKDHKHYRIKFRSLNKRIDNYCLWMPDHWVARIPEELLSI